MRKNRIHIIENNRNNNSKLFFEKANDVKHGYNTRLTIMKRCDGILLTENNKIT